jgi:hypothetical protein
MSTHQLGDRPLDLAAVLGGLVSLLVPPVVDPLRDARDELGGALADPPPELVLALAADAAHLTAHGRIDDDYQPLPLREPGGRRSLGEPGDALDDHAIDPAVHETADGTALHDDVDELHRDLLCVRRWSHGRPSRRTLRALEGIPSR